MNANVNMREFVIAVICLVWESYFAAMIVGCSVLFGVGSDDSIGHKFIPC